MQCMRAMRAKARQKKMWSISRMQCANMYAAVSLVPTTQYPRNALHPAFNGKAAKCLSLLAGQRANPPAVSK